MAFFYVSKDKMKRTLIEMFFRVEKHARHNYPSDIAIGVGSKFGRMILNKSKPKQFT